MLLGHRSILPKPRLGIRKCGTENWEVVSSTTFLLSWGSYSLGLPHLTNFVASESPAGLVEMQIAELLAKVSKSVGLRRGLRVHNLTSSPVMLLVWIPT